MALSRILADALLDAHDEVQTKTRERRVWAARRSEIAKRAQAEVGTSEAIKEIQALLGLSRTGVVKILKGA